MSVFSSCLHWKHSAVALISSEIYCGVPDSCQILNQINHIPTKTPNSPEDSWICLSDMSYIVSTAVFMLLLLLLSRFSRVRPCDPIDGSPPGSAVPGILQARTLEWVAISFSDALKWKVKVKSLSCVRLFATPWTAAYQAPPSMGFSRQEYWSGVPLPSPLNHLVCCKCEFFLKKKKKLN